MSGQGGPFRFDPLALAQEAMQFQRRLAQGLQVLARVGEVDYGATRREEVWRDGKTVLYRFVGEREPSGPALLIVYALVNRPYMVDLQADRSLVRGLLEDRKSTRLNSSHVKISYAVFCLKIKN